MHMFRDVIIENCRRLLTFYKDNDKYADHSFCSDISYAGLLKTYGRLLDIYGAPRSYMSRLYIPSGHYSDFVDYAEKLPNFKEINFKEVSGDSRSAISFDHDGYNWVVEKK